MKSHVQLALVAIMALVSAGCHQVVEFGDKLTPDGHVTTLTQTIAFRLTRDGEVLSYELSPVTIPMGMNPPVIVPARIELHNSQTSAILNTGIVRVKGNSPVVRGIRIVAAPPGTDLVMMSIPSGDVVYVVSSSVKHGSAISVKTVTGPYQELPLNAGEGAHYDAATQKLTKFVGLPTGSSDIENAASALIPTL